MSASAEYHMNHHIELDPIHIPSSNTDLIGAALARAQLEMVNPAFDMVNPHFRNKYASLAAVRDAVIPVLAKHGIALVQNLRTVHGETPMMSVETTLYHSSGQFLKFDGLDLPVMKRDAQGFGSAATYARRYALMAIAGVVGEPDDDANTASGNMVAAHTDGLKALERVWKAAPTGCAQWATKHRQDAVKALKAAAGKVSA